MQVKNAIVTGTLRVFGIIKGTAEKAVQDKNGNDITTTYAPSHSCGSTDLEAGSSPLETGKLHVVYE